MLIKKIKVEGSSMIANQETSVRRISLNHENSEYIEGKVDGQNILLITKFIKKTIKLLFYFIFAALLINKLVKDINTYRGISCAI